MPRRCTAKCRSFNLSKLVALNVLLIGIWGLDCFRLDDACDFIAPTELTPPRAIPTRLRRTQTWLQSRDEREVEQVEQKTLTSQSRWTRLRNWFTDAENRRRFASMGAAGVLSYGVVSNANYIPLFAYAWYLVSVHTKVSPLHQWPAFLSTYATLYVFNNVLRPIKLVALGLVTPRVDSCFNWLAGRGIGRKRAVLLVYVVLNSLTILLMALSVFGASCLAGVRIW